jgi:hypothetical protein
MSSYSFTAIADKVLLWLHGRRFGITGDGQGPTPASGLVLDGVMIGSSRSGANSLKVVAAGLNGKGAVTVTGTKVGDNVELVLNTAGGASADATSSFEATVSVAGQVQQSSASNLSGNYYLFFIQPQV